MSTPEQLLENNRQWAQEVGQQDANFFERSAQGQSPPFLWLGCSDSRVPAEQIAGLRPGDMFVHRNIANVINGGDPSSAAIMAFAVGVLKVSHIIVCGHYRCGGVIAADADSVDGVLADWLAPIRAIKADHADELAALDDTARVARLCELNAIGQAASLASHPVIRARWEQGDELAIHAWIYDLASGQLKDLNASISGPAS